MATTKKQRALKRSEKKTPAKKNRILATSHISPSIGTPPKETDRKIELVTDWILYYAESRNAFPNQLADKNLKSGTNSAIINSKHTLTVGNGLRYTKDGKEYTPNTQEQDYLDAVNVNGLSFEELYDNSAADWIGFGADYIEGVRVDKQVFWFPHDVTRVRLGPRNKDGFIEQAYISPDWVQIGNQRSLTMDQPERMKIIPMYDGSDTQERFIIKITREYPGLDYYGVPDYMAAVLSGWVDINYRIGKFNIDDLDNGLMPSALLQFFGEPPEGMTPKEYVQSIRDNFTGEGNNGKFLTQLLDDPAQAANITLFDRIQQGHFETLDKMADQSLITAHGWYRSLTGLAEAGSLGNTQQIRNELDMAMTHKIIPAYRRPLNRYFNRLLKIAGFDFQVGVKNLQPLTLSNDIDVNKCLTVNEGREVIGFAKHEEEEIGNQLIDLEDREDDTTNQGSNGST